MQTLVLAKKVCDENQKKEINKQRKIKKRRALYTSHKEVSAEDCH